MVLAAERAAERLAADGVDVELVDLRSLQPLDVATVIGSVRRTGRLVTAHEAWVIGGIGAEVVAAVAEACPGVRVARVGALPVPTPSGHVRPHALPNAERIEAAIRQVLGASIAPGARARLGP